MRCAHRYTYVFTTGGIGPTHDDITADAVAKAFGVALPINPQAREMLEDALEGHRHRGQRGAAAHGAHSRGRDLIVNSVSAAPGFRIGNVHVMAGVPVIMRAMLEAIAPTLKGGRKVHVRHRQVQRWARAPSAAPLGALQDAISRTSRWAAIRGWATAR